MKIAILDDWAGVAREYAPWDTLDAELQFFNAHIPAGVLSATLAPFDVIRLMRERTPRGDRRIRERTAACGRSMAASKEALWGKATAESVSGLRNAGNLAAILYRDCDGHRRIYSRCANQDALNCSSGIWRQ